MILPTLTKSRAAALRRDLAKLPRLDEKRVALRQFILESKKLARQRFDLIVYPLFSGLIPATLFNDLYARRHRQQPLPMLEYATLSSLSKNGIAKAAGDYGITFNAQAEPILAKIEKDLLIFTKKNQINLSRAQILLIDANLAQGITVACFVEVLRRLDYNFKNLTLVITDSRASDPKLPQAPQHLLRGGRLVLFNQANMTNKVFDNVLTVSAYALDRKNLKTLRRGKVIYHKKQLNFYPYYLSLALFQQELASGH